MAQWFDSWSFVKADGHACFLRGMLCTLVLADVSKLSCSVKFC
jgi:hypothetical protein